MDLTDNLSPSRKLRRTAAAKVSEAFRAEGYRPVQYGGATVEEYTEGMYSTGDVDIGFVDRAPSLEDRARVMERLGCQRGIRLFDLGGVLVDLGGQAESYSRNFIELKTDDGPILLEAPEESMVQRILMGVYPQFLEEQWEAGRLMVAQAVAGRIPVDWEEVLRLARLPGFRVEKELRQLVAECSARLGVAAPSGF